MTRFCLLFLIIINILSCGFNNNITKAHQTSYIKDLKIINNQISFTTEDSTYVYLSYKERFGNNSKYEAWSAGQPSLNHTYLLPIKNEGVDYQIKLAVLNLEKSILKDTTFVFTSTLHQEGFLKVHYINVQQGDAILIQTPEGKNIQIDGGYGTRGNQPWQGDGLPLALEYITNLDITHLDYILETHRHLDHWGGLQDILDSPISHDIYLSPSNRHGYQIGSTLAIDSSVVFQIYNIGYDDSYTGNNLNNSSIVMKVIYHDAEFLFMGDGEGIVQDWLYEREFDLSADVLMAAHHGANSNNTSDTIFLNKVLNQYAQIVILSYGENNSYGHPRALNRFTKYQTYGTNPAPNTPAGNNFKLNSGSIEVITDGKMIYVTTER